MKKNLLFLGLIILGIGGYFFYQKKNQQQTVVTNFIPDNTILLLETNEISTAKNKILPRIPLLSRANQQYQIFKQIGLSEKEISRLLLKKTLYFAVLPEGKGDFSFVNYLPLNADNEDFIKKLEVLSQNTTGYRVVPHTTQGFKILEVINNDGKILFSYIIQNDFLIFSKSNLAVEEAILHQENTWVKSLSLSSASIENDSLFTVTHFNHHAINDFIEDISVIKTNSSNHIFTLFPQSFQWLKPTANYLEGVSTNKNQNLFEEQKVLEMSNLNMIPNASSFMIDFSFNDAEQLLHHIKKLVKNDAKISSLREKASSKFDINFENIYKKIEREITFCSFNGGESNLSDKVLIINQKNLLNQFKVIARNVAREGEEDVFSVQYGSFMIINLGIREFPSLLFGNIFDGFEECYFTEYSDKLILASSLSAMQEYLVSVGRGDVWGNSPKHKTILKSCLPANLTVISESAKIIPNFQKGLNSTWFNKISNHNQELSSVQAQILQSSATESRIVLLKNIEPVKSSIKYDNKWLKLGKVAVSVNSEPLYLVNPDTKNAQIMVQSADNKINLYEAGKRIWTYQLSGKIIGEIKSSRVFNQSVQQFLAVTSKNVYVFLRTEKGFEVRASKSFKGYDLNNYKVFENDKDYQQFLTLVNANGETFKLNKESLVVTKNENSSKTNDILVPFPNIIVNQEEFGIYLSKSGKLTLQNSMGKVAKGFPMSFNGVFNTSPILEGGENNIVLLSEKGELYRVSLSGKIIDKKQLFRPNNEVKFSIAMNERGNDWVLMRTDNKEVVVIDKNEHELFMVSSSVYGKKALLYYNLGIGGKFFAINNGYSTYNFYDESGNYIGGLPIESEYKPRLSYSDSYQKVIMNITTLTSIETWSVKIR
jgi:hypothetical protein